MKLRERGAKATRSIVIEPVDRLTVNIKQLPLADGIAMATDSPSASALSNA